MHSISRMDIEVDRLTPIEGQPPDLIDMESGCAFRPRCLIAVEKCSEKPPPITEIPGEHRFACFVDVTEEQKPLAQDAGQETSDD